MVGRVLGGRPRQGVGSGLVGRGPNGKRGRERLREERERVEERKEKRQ